MSEPVQTSQLGPAEAQPPANSFSHGASEAAWVPWARSWFRDLFLAGFIAAVIILFFYQPVRVEGTSMMPRLSDQERIFINKFVYRLEDIHRGDVVVFWYPGDPTKSYIKRVIGLPGDTVEIDRKSTRLNSSHIQKSRMPSSA